MTTWLQTLAAPLVSTLQHPLVDNIVRLSAVEDTLQALHPEVHVDVRLHWHQWKLRSGEPGDDGTPPSADSPVRAGVLDRVGRALAEGAARVLAGQETPMMWPIAQEASAW